MANEKRLIDANALCEFFQERYEFLRNASETQLPNGNVEIDLDIQVGAIIAKEFLDKAKQASTVDAVEVVHGRWIIKSEIHRMLDDFDEVFYVECPLCGRTFYIPFEFDDGKMLAYAKEKYPYCNCGAKMDGDGNG